MCLSLKNIHNDQLSGTSGVSYFSRFSCYLALRFRNTTKLGKVFALVGSGMLLLKVHTMNM
jgi:hypothetical protein